MIYLIESLRKFWFLRSNFTRNTYYSPWDAPYIIQSFHVLFISVSSPSLSVHVMLLSKAQLVSPPPQSLPQLLQPTVMPSFSKLLCLLLCNHLLIIFYFVKVLCVLQVFTSSSVLQFFPQIYLSYYFLARNARNKVNRQINLGKRIYCIDREFHIHNTQRALSSVYIVN